MEGVRHSHPSNSLEYHPGMPLLLLRAIKAAYRIKIINKNNKNTTSPNGSHKTVYRVKIGSHKIGSQRTGYIMWKEVVSEISWYRAVKNFKSQN